MKYIKLILTLVIFSVLITSCSKKSKLGKMIPKEAAVVIHLNTKSLLSKLSWDEIKQSYWYNEMMSDTSISATSKTFISDPAKTGIDINSDIVFFVLKPNNNGQAVVEGSIKDSKAFADFLKGMHPTATVSKDGELNIFKTDDAAVGWNDDKFVFVSNVDQHKFQGMDSLSFQGTDSLSNLIDSPTVAVPPAPVSPDSLVSVCKNIFALNDDNSLYKNERFADLEAEEGDIHFWMNTGELYKGSMSNMPGMAAMVKLDKFLEDNVSTGTLNFQDGKITGTGKQYFGKELSDILKNDEGEINSDMIKRLPSQNVAGVIAFHFTPGNLLQIIKLTGLDGFINLFLGQKGLSLDDIMKATKGDMLFAVSDVTIKADSLVTDTITHGTITRTAHGGPSASFLFSVSIGDKDAFNKLLNLWDTELKGPAQKNIFQKTDDKYFAISNRQDAVNKYFAGTQSTPDFLSKINDHSMGGYLDAQMIMKALQPELTKDSIGKLYYDRNISMWNNAYFTGGDYKNGGLVSNGELNLIDKTTNSLKQLNQYINDMAKIRSEQKKKQKTNWRIDSVSSKSQTDTVLRKKR